MDKIRIVSNSNVFYEGIIKGRLESMKKKIVGMAAALALMASVGISGTGESFADIDWTKWNSAESYPQDIINTEFMTPVSYLIDKKILTGYEDGTFQPKNTITRAEFATIMAKATNNTEQLALDVKEEYFKDLTGQYAWSKGYVNACKRAGLINGKSADTFAPGDPVSYVEVVAIIVRSKNPSAVENTNWPYNYIQYALGNLNSMVGDRNINDWTAPATRGDVAMMVYRSLPKR